MCKDGGEASPGSEMPHSFGLSREILKRTSFLPNDGTLGVTLGVFFCQMQRIACQPAASTAPTTGRNRTHPERLAVYCTDTDV